MNLIEFLKSNNGFDLKNQILDSKIITTDEIVGISYFATEKFYKDHKNMMIIAPNLFTAEQIRNELYSLVGPEKIIFIPAEELLMVEYAAASNDILSDRIAGLYEATFAYQKIVVTNVSAASRYYPKKELFLENVFKLKVGDDTNLSALRKTLVSSGYEVVNKISKSGQCAFRGSIVDIFSLDSDYPVRIDFFDTEIESLHHFNIDTQETFNSINEYLVLPFTEQLYSENDEKACESRIKLRLEEDLKLDHNPELEGNILLDLDMIEEHIKEPKYYKYFKFLSTDTGTLFDYFRCDTVIYSNYENIIEVTEKLMIDENDFIHDLREKGKSLSGLSLFDSRWMEKYKGTAVKNELFSSFNKFEVRPPIFLNNSLQAIEHSLKFYIDNGYKIYCSFASERQRLYFIENTLRKIFPSDELDDLFKNTFVFGDDNVTLGFEIVDLKIVVLSQKELLGYKLGTNKFTSKFRQGTILKSYEDLQKGDYVVHEDYGIGIYDGIYQIDFFDTVSDFLRIKYAGDQNLEIPLDQFGKVRKYVSRDGKAPKLNSLFNNKWEGTKAKIKKKIDDLAEKLSDLYRTQLTIKGYKFPEDDELQMAFENDFEYELTKDQQEAVDEIKKDMEQEYPMDRLVCGDVGFGKTEVAFRAAFKAINSGKQVLLLCPTTLLATQHYSRALERFSKFDVKIACLTRFLTQKEFKQELESIKSGKTHLIIGTHRALSNKIEFSDLGLLIIDEEQRFGVEQKEKIKMKFPNIDSLVLSSTPIPRTIQTALVGMKSLSLINTAPKNRAPIQTYLIEHDDKIVFDLIKRELGRKGQVYYLHNEIPNIDKIAEKIRENVPNSEVAFINGQMDKDEIDEIMNQFYVGNVQVLVATTIIENGIDVPNANLIIIENADKFGLAQLYQIKGRVGRSDKIAYAYLTYDPKKMLTEEAKKRLSAIKEFTELGSGYKIAQRDLMIRGAGDILGKEQAGFIDDIGVDLYVKLLNEAVSERQNGSTTKKKQKSITYRGYIPNEFAEETNKFEIYQLLNDASNVSELERAKAKIKDEFGNIPAELQRIINIKYLKIILNSEMIDTFEENLEYIEVTLNPNFNKIKGVGVEIMLVTNEFKPKIKFISGKIVLRLNKSKTWIEDMIKILDRLMEIYKKNEA